MSSFRAPVLALVLLISTAGWSSAGTVLKDQRIDAASLARAVPYTVYLPDTDAPAAEMPVLYLLHGLGGNERDWLNMGKIEATADRLIANGEIPAMLIVMPAAGNSWYVDSAKHGAMETALIKEVIPGVEARFGGRRDRRNRLIAGLSMGGYGALRLAFRHPDLFGATASLSGAIFPDMKETSDVGGKQVRMFRGAFGQPFSVATFNRRNLFQHVADLRAARDLSIFLTVGDDDGFGLHRGSISLFLALRDANIPVEMRITDGDHKWRLWRRSISDVLRFFADTRKRPPG